MPRFAAATAVLLLCAHVALAQPVPLSVNVSSREEVRQFYQAIYHASDNVPMEWTGSYSTGNAGDVSAAYKEATRLRINFFRALAGVPAGISFNSTYNTKAQQAALMMSANNALSHSPPASWTFYTAVGAEAAANSNLNLGGAGPVAVTSYIADAGANNAVVGHRRWLFYPQTRQMGTGDVPGHPTDQNRPAANAVWVVDTTPGGQFGAPRPATRTPAIAYPPAGFVPYQLVWPRWSFSLPNADFSAATVTMTRNGESIPVRLEPLGTGIAGEPTLVWVYDGRNTDEEIAHPKPTADTTYSVRINNVRVAGVRQDFPYNVTVFDPDVAGPDAAPVAVSAAGMVSVGAANSIAVTKPAFAAGFDWRTLQLAPFAKTYTAEAGLDGLSATTSAGYAVVQTRIVATGSAAYRLAHVPPRAAQILALPQTFHVNGPDAAVAFRSRLAIATSTETARVQVSTDDGMSWTDLFVQAGTSPLDTGFPPSTENAFVARTLTLGAYAGRTIKIRFVYAIGTGAAFLPAETNDVGWFIDDVTVTNVQTVTLGATARVATGSTFDFTPSAAGTLLLQARAVLFRAYPAEWGPVARLTAVEGALSDPGRLINLSILTALSGSGDELRMGYVVGGAGTSGSKPVLIRAAGPSLTPLGVSGALDDPRMELFAGSARTAENDNWGGAPTLGAAFTAVGAFPFASAGSRDAALLADIASGDNTVRITATAGGSGAVLAELYDSSPAATFTTATPRLVNVSVLKHLGSGLTAGFVIGGSSSKMVLIRAVGPTLGAAPFNVPDVVANPRLELFAGSSSIGVNDDWGGTAELTAAFTRVGAFSLPSNSRDAAVVATLAPGNYTAQVSGVNNTTGVALVEVYEVP